MTQGMTLADAIFGCAAGAILHGLTILITAQVAPMTAQRPAMETLIEADRHLIFLADCGLRRDCLDLPPPPSEIWP